MLKYDPLNYLRLRIRKETTVLDEKTRCEVTNPKKETIERLNPNTITALVKEAEINFSNHDVLEKLFCLFRTTLVMTKGIADDRVANTSRVLQYISKLSVLTNKSKFGIIYNVNEGQDTPLEDLILVKTLKDPVKGTLFHEFFIAAAFTNSLRRIIPNFAYTYAYFKCSNPQFGQSNSIPVSYCTNTANPGEYLIMEKINGDTLTLWCQNPTSVSDFLSTIIQLILSLRTASLLNGFTHFDLHTGNVILRNISTNVAYIKYPYTDGGRIEKYKYIRCTKVATMIDFGYSFINYKNHSYSMPDFDKEYHQQSKPLVDIYRIIMWSLFVLKTVSRTNKKALHILTSLFKLARLFSWIDNMYKRASDENPKWTEIDRIRAVMNSPEHRMDPKDDKQGPAFMLTKNQEKYEPRYYQDDPWMGFVFDIIAAYPDETKGIVLDNPPPVGPILVCESGQCRTAESIATELHPVDVTAAGKRILA